MPEACLRHDEDDGERKNLRTSFAPPQRAAIEMEVVVVGGAVLGAQHHPEIAAGGAMRGSQETRFRPAAVPMPAHGDLAFVGEREAADINGVGGGVLAAPALPGGIADDVAARVGAEALHGRDALADTLANLEGRTVAFVATLSDVDSASNLRLNAASLGRRVLPLPSPRLSRGEG